MCCLVSTMFLCILSKWHCYLFRKTVYPELVNDINNKCSLQNYLASVTTVYIFIGEHAVRSSAMITSLN